MGLGYILREMAKARLLSPYTQIAYIVVVVVVVVVDRIDVKADVVITLLL